MRTRAPIRRPSGSRSACGATSAGSRTITSRAPTALAVDAPSYVIEAPSHETDEEVTEFNPVIIAESTTLLKQFSVSEAVMELDMTGAPVVVFRHASHGRVNVVYRRPDGNVGWVDPPPHDPAKWAPVRGKDHAQI